MKKVKDFKTMYEAMQGDFLDYISYIKLYLKKRDKEYKRYLDTIAKIKEKNKKIETILEGIEEVDFELTKKDYEDLQQAILVQFNIQSKEEKAIFYGGFGNCICLLRELDRLEE